LIFKLPVILAKVLYKDKPTNSLSSLSKATSINGKTNTKQGHYWKTKDLLWDEKFLYEWNKSTLW